MTMIYRDASRFFLGRIVDISNPRKYHHDLQQAEKFQNSCPQMLENCFAWPCMFLDFFVKHFTNYISLHYKISFFLDNFKKINIFK